MNRRKFLGSLGAVGGAGVATVGIYRRAMHSSTDPVDAAPEAPSSNSSDSSSGPSAPGARASPGADVVEDFEDLSGWAAHAGRLSADETRYHVGTQSARIDVGASDDRGSIAREFDAPVDMSGSHLSMAMRADGYALPRMQLFDVDGNRLTLRTAVPGGFPFRRYDFGIDGCDESFDPTAVTEVRFVEFVGESRRTIWCDDLRALDRPDTGMVMFQFDDGNVTDYTRALPVLEEYDYPAVTFVNPGKIGEKDHLSLDQLRELRDSGWTVGSHSYDHVHLPELDAARQERQLRRSKEWLIERGFEDGAEYFAYPFTEYDAETRSLVEEYHTLGFAGGFPGVGRVTNPLELHRLGDPDPSPAKEAVDVSVRWNGITPLFFHWLTEDGRDEFEAIVEYVHELESAGEIEVVSPETVENELLY